MDPRERLLRLLLAYIVGHGPLQPGPELAADLLGFLESRLGQRPPWFYLAEVPAIDRLAYVEHIGRLTALGLLVGVQRADDLAELAGLFEQILASLGAQADVRAAVWRALQDGSAAAELRWRVDEVLREARLELERADPSLHVAALAERLYRQLLRSRQPDELNHRLLAATLRRDDLCDELFTRLGEEHRREQVRLFLRGTARPSAEPATGSWLNTTLGELLGVAPGEAELADVGRAVDLDRFLANVRRVLEAVLAPPSAASVLALLVAGHGEQAVGRVARLSVELVEGDGGETLRLEEASTARFHQDARESCALACAWLSDRLRRDLSDAWDATADRRTVRLVLDGVTDRGGELEGSSLGIATALAILAELTGLHVSDVAVTGAVVDAAGRVGAVRSIPEKLLAIRLRNQRAPAFERIRRVLVPTGNAVEARDTIAGWSVDERIGVEAIGTLDEAIDVALGDPWGAARQAWLEEYRQPERGESWLAVLEQRPASPLGRALPAAVARLSSVLEAGSGARVVARSPWLWEPTSVAELGQSSAERLARALAGATVRARWSDRPLHQQLRALRGAPVPIVVAANDPSDLVALLQRALPQPDRQPEPPARIATGLRTGRFAFVVYGLGVAPDGQVERLGFFQNSGALATILNLYPRCPVIVLAPEGVWRALETWTVERLTPGRSTVFDRHLVEVTGERDPAYGPLREGERSAGLARERILACRPRLATDSRPPGLQPSPREFFDAASLASYLPLRIVPWVDGRRAAEPATTLLDVLRERPAAKLLVLGPSGSGKTTELLHVFYRALAGDLGRLGSGDSAVVPFYAGLTAELHQQDLRSFVLGHLVRGSDFLEPFARRCLNGTVNLVLLLDGLNEALSVLAAAHPGDFETARQRLLRRFSALREPPFDGCRVVLTSRPTLTGDDDFIHELLGLGIFRVYELLDLTAEEGERWALDYLSAVADPGWHPSPLGDESRRPAAVTQLRQVLGEHRLTVLQKPIMVYLLSTILWRFKTDAWPGREGELTLARIYQIAIDDWLEEEYQRLEKGPGTQVRQPQTYRELLRLLACGMHDRAVASLSVEQAIEVLAAEVEAALSSKSTMPDWWPETNDMDGKRLWRGTRRVNAQAVLDRNDLRRLLAELLQGTLLRVA